jgi:Family of unknown function (DUF6209)
MTINGGSWFRKAVVIGALGLMACGPQGQERLPDGIRPASAPRPLGSADGFGDQADSDCLVVLRSVGRIKQGPGYATTCDLGGSSGSCLYVWEGQVDLDAAQAAKVQAVEVLFNTSQTGAAWYAVKAVKQATSPTAGFTRYTFRIDQYTPAAGMSMTSLNGTVIELIPYAKTATGRVFDHNRVKHALGTYRLDHGNLWQVSAAPAVCAPKPAAKTPRYVLDYPAFNESLHDGPAVAGGKLQIEYDSKRLRETQSCFGSQGPVSSTTIMMGYTFDDKGPAKTTQVEQYIKSYGNACQPHAGSPCIDQTIKKPVIDLPAGASQLQLWFYCVPGFSSGAQSNWRYDSNHGKNYRLDLVAPATAPTPVDWAGNWLLHAGRSGFSSPLAEPHVYSGFTNMGWSIQAEVYVKGHTDQAYVTKSTVKAFVESDLLTCSAGGTLTKVELPLAGTHVGSYGNNSLYRWGFEGIINHCPKGTYRFRFLVSADGGKTVIPLGKAASIDAAGSTAYRTLVHQ